MYQRVWAEINLNYINHNLKSIKASLTPKTKICAVVKADGYGHGALPVSSALCDAGADMFGVATFDEGISLREGGIKKPILLLGYAPESHFGDIISAGLTKTVYDYETACILSEKALHMSTKARVHIKVETGMNRLGFPASDTDAILKTARLSGLEITGIFSHFADAEERAFTFAQFERFENCLRTLEKNGLFVETKHFSNSPATLRYRELDMDMVRPGLCLYGYGGDFLKPALSLKTVISQLKEIYPGETVGYARTFKADKRLKVATLPIGYADGYSRAFSNRGRVLIDGQFARILGLVCMDQMMVDVSDIDAKYGDEVVLIGQSKGEKITADDLAMLSDTISYEILCGIGKRVPRVYV